MTRRLALAAALALLLALAAAPSAFAHAQLLGTSPCSGATVKRNPRGDLRVQPARRRHRGAVRVYNAHGAEVDNLDVTHPDGNSHWMGVGLSPHLPDGTYTATYRVISADTHIVYGGLVFNIGHASASSKVTVTGLISRGESGEVTKLAFGVVRALDYLTLALMVGGLAFLFFVWPPAPALRRRASRAGRPRPRPSLRRAG